MSLNGAKNNSPLEERNHNEAGVQSKDGSSEETLAKVKHNVQEDQFNVHAIHSLCHQRPHAQRESL